MTSQPSVITSQIKNGKSNTRFYLLNTVEIVLWKCYVQKKVKKKKILHIIHLLKLGVYVCCSVVPLQHAIRNSSLSGGFNLQCPGEGAQPAHSASFSSTARVLFLFHCSNRVTFIPIRRFRSKQLGE